MPNRPIADLESLVGESRPTVSGFRVERAKVAEFAAAIRAEDPVYTDPAVATERGYDRLPAPLLFPWAAMADRYWPSDAGWPGFDVGFDLSRSLHGEQAYEFERPLFVGDSLYGTTTVTDVYRRDGNRGGAMTFAEFETAFRDAETDDLVVTERSTLIEMAETRGGSDATTDDAHDDTTDGASGPDTSTWSLTVEDVSRTDFVKWAGAVGDFSRVHFDEPFATASGYRSVFAQGMLVAGYASRLVTDRVPLAAVESFDVRFSGIVYPGQTLHFVGDPVESAATDARSTLHVTGTTADGTEKLTATATADLS